MRVVCRTPYITSRAFVATNSLFSEIVPKWTFWLIWRLYQCPGGDEHALQHRINNEYTRKALLSITSTSFSCTHAISKVFCKSLQGLLTIRSSIVPTGAFLFHLPLWTPPSIISQVQLNPSEATCKENNLYSTSNSQCNSDITHRSHKPVFPNPGARGPLPCMV